jgi:hypothetical protein
LDYGELTGAIINYRPSGKFWNVFTNTIPEGIIEKIKQ